jgi:hypothetical protein
MANYSREPRNELIRRLREQGWSFRRIGAHPKVQLSAGMVHAIIHADDADDDADELGPSADDAFHAVSAVGSGDDGTITDAELLDELYLPDGRPNGLTFFRLRHGDGHELTPAQVVMVRAAVDAADALLSPEERERRRWAFRGPPQRHEHHGVFAAVVEERPWHVNVGKWTWTWAGGAEEYRAFSRGDSAEAAMAHAAEWVQRRWHGEG